MKKNAIALAAAAAVAATLASPSFAADKVKIGYVTTLTTGAAVLGRDMKDAFDLGMDHIGGKMGGLDVEVIYEDDGFKPDIGKQKTDKLVQKDRVDFVAGYIWSHVLLASYKSVVGKGPILVSSNAGPSPIAGKLCHKDFFSASWQNDQTPMAMGEALNKRGVKSIYVIAPNYAAGKDMVKGVTRTYKGEILGRDMTKWPGQLDFSAELAKARAANPEAIFAFYPGKAGVQFMKQFEQSGLKGKIPLYTVFTVDGISLPRLKDLAVGSLATQTWVPDLDNAMNKKFVADFEKKYGRTPSFYAAQAYDTVYLIKAAVEGAKGNLKDKAAMRAAITSGNWDTTRGKLKYGNNNFPIQNIYLRQAVKEGEAYKLKTVSTVYTGHQDSYAGSCKMK